MRETEWYGLNINSRQKVLDYRKFKILDLQEKKCNIMKCMSQFIRIMSLKMRWVRIWATFDIQTNEAIRVQKSLEGEVTALQQLMLSMQNQSQINSSAISGYQEGALVVGKSLVENERKDLCNISPIMVHYVLKEVFRMQKLFFLLKMWVISCYLFCKCHYSYLKFF